MRIYMVLAVFAGAGLYFFFLSRGVLKIGYLIADFLGVLWHMATLPARGVFALCKKIGKNAKKSFHYRRKWYKIKLIPGEMDETVRRKKTRQGGGASHENQKGGISDQRS